MATSIQNSTDITAPQSGMQFVDLDRVLQTAASLFATFGFEGVSTREIARSSGCHVPSIYYHFSSKENLYRETCEEKLEDSLELVRERIKQADDPETRLRALLAAFCEHFTQDRELFLLIQRDVINAAVARPRFLFGSHYQHFMNMIRELSSELTGHDIGQHRAFVVLSMIFGYCGLWLVADGAESPSGNPNELIDIIMQIIKA